jgi:hypothetical protein
MQDISTYDSIERRMIERTKRVRTNEHQEIRRVGSMIVQVMRTDRRMIEESKIRNVERIGDASDADVSGIYLFGWNKILRTSYFR